MSFLNPNPPQEVSAIVRGLQMFYAYGTRNMNSASPAVSPSAANALAISAIGAQLFSPTYSTLNPVTRIPREVRQSGAAANANCGWFVDNTGAGACTFPAQNGDAGYRTRLYCGTDSVVGGVATTQLVSGVARTGGGAVPGSIAMNNAAISWMGLYNEGAGGGLRFGFKPAGSVVITALDVAGSLAGLWAPYQGWLIDIHFDPRGPRTYYSVSQLNAAGSSFDPVLIGSTVAFNPGRISMGPWHVARPTVAASNTDLWFLNATQLAYPLGSLSLL